MNFLGTRSLSPWNRPILIVFDMYRKGAVAVLSVT